MSALRGLARVVGLDVEYTNFKGEQTSASDESVLATLRALAPDLGIQLERSEDAPGALVAFERETWRQLVPPVVIGWKGDLVVPFSVPADKDGAWEVEVVTETGRTVHATGRLFDLPAGSHAHPGGIVHCVRRATISVGEEGYHSARWKLLGEQGEAFAVSAPERAYGGPGTGARRWGVFAPVYGLASAQSGQAGDLGNLARLFDAVAHRGGRYVATLPILAQFLDEPCAFSPYSPASRTYWNECYLDLAALAAQAGMTPPTAPPIVAGTLIDFKTQYHWRRLALDPICQRIAATPQLSSEIEAWAAKTGAYDYAAFRAIGEHQRAGWREWPAPWRDGVPMIETRPQAIALGADGGRLTTHVVAQWAMQRQLEAIAAHGQVGLYLDLPVGVNMDAYEVWRDRHLFLTELGAGAPPDPLFLGGQNWGLPPLSPIALRRDRYRYFIRCVQHHMRVAGVLRIDHVMGLFRLYCVPQGRPATDGVYVRYAYEEMLAILALESVRNKCALVGEDLGTVPEQVRPAMARHALFRLHVGQWFLPTKIGDHPQASPAESIASLNTHDTATFAGWWRGADIDDRRDLDLITGDQEATERVERDAQKAALLAFAGPGTVDDVLTDVERALVAAQADLARGPAEVVLIALDDLSGQPFPHNVPGTVSERPNWQRRVDGWADALVPGRASAVADAVIAAIVAARTS